MTLEEIEKQLNPEDLLKTIQVFFNEESGLHYLNLNPDFVDKIMIKDGFLKIYDTAEKCWHCYNVNCVLHYHIPDGWNNRKCSGRVQT